MNKNNFTEHQTNETVLPTYQDCNKVFLKVGNFSRHKAVCQRKITEKPNHSQNLQNSILRAKEIQNRFCQVSIHKYIR